MRLLLRLACGALITVTVLQFQITTATAQVIDVSSTINNGLATAGQVRKTRTVTRRVRDCEERCCRRCEADCIRCFDKDVQQQEVFTEPLRTTSVQVMRVFDLRFGEPIINALPEAIRLQTFRSRNCSSIQQTTSTSLSVNVTNSDSVSVSRALSTGTTVGANVNFTLPGGIGSAGANVSVSRQFSLTTSEAQARTNSLTLTENINKVVPARTELWGELRSVESNLSVPFSVRVLVDGTVDGNLDGYSKVSQVLSEAQRTIATEGVLAVTAASEAKTAFFDRPLTQQECGGSVPSGAFETQTFEGSGVPLGAAVSPAEIALDPDNGIFVESLEGLEGKIEAKIASFTADVLAASADSAASNDTSIDRSTLKEGDRLDTIGFAAAGTHQCQSATDIGHMCNVVDIGFDDCNQAAIQLRLRDCCPTTRVCGADPATGELKCRYGGTSIGFTISYCVPF